jgi:hypothetical protein
MKKMFLGVKHHNPNPLMVKALTILPLLVFLPVVVD